MKNPILGNQPNLVQMISQFKNNPQQLISQMFSNNPQFQQVNEWVKQYGSPENAFRQKAQEMGLNPDEIINLLK